MTLPQPNLYNRDVTPGNAGQRVWRVLLVALVCAVGLAVAQVAAPPPPLGPTILISFDGWRADYETLAPTPNLRRLADRGVQAEYLIPSFPAKTFPNHYTIATGLYPGHHGIVSNAIKDIPTGRVFTTGRREEVTDPMWWGGEPIWVTAERAGLITAAMFWPGTEGPIGGVRPRYWKPYDSDFPTDARVDQVLEWLDLPEAERPAFVTLYFSDVDSAGHDYGPDSPQVRGAIELLDTQLGRLMEGLRARELLDRTNIVLVSDHGMSAVSTDRVVVLDDYISLDDVEVVDINPLLGLVPRPGKEDSVYQALLNAHPRLHVYRRDTMPEAWRYTHSRVPPVFGVVDEGWQILRRSTLEAIQAGRVLSGGQHGYDPAVASSMRAMFIAAGPAFKAGVRVPPFQNIHIYNALAAALKIRPAQNDGDPAVARSLMR